MGEHASGSPDRGRVTSGAMAMALVIAAVAVWWLLSGNGPQGPGGNDPRYAVPDVDASGPAEPTGPSSSPEPAVPGGLRLDGYTVIDELRLSVSYLAERCAELRSPRVLETDASVTITLVADVDRGCDRPLEAQTVQVLIDSPLDGRAVLDGSTSPLVRVESSEG